VTPPMPNSAAAQSTSPGAIEVIEVIEIPSDTEVSSEAASESVAEAETDSESVVVNEGLSTTRPAVAPRPPIMVPLPIRRLKFEGIKVTAFRVGKIRESPTGAPAVVIYFALTLHLRPHIQAVFFHERSGQRWFIEPGRWDEDSPGDLVVFDPFFAGPRALREVHVSLSIRLANVYLGL
jgi:hypothetical protein